MDKMPGIPYPLILSEPVPGCQLLMPDPDQVQKVFKQRRATDQDTPFPYWARIWPAARVLTAYLLDHPQLYTDRSVLEIGAGIGMPSFAIAGTAASVCMTDHDPEALDLLKKNIELHPNKKLGACLLDWNHPPENLQAELVLCSDLNYAPDAMPGLTRLLLYFIQTGSTIVLSTPQRAVAAPFVDTLLPFCRQQHSITATEDAGQMPLSLFVLTGNSELTAERFS